MDYPQCQSCDTIINEDEKFYRLKLNDSKKYRIDVCKNCFINYSLKMVACIGDFRCYYCRNTYYKTKFYCIEADLFDSEDEYDEDMFILCHICNTQDNIKDIFKNFKEYIFDEKYYEEITSLFFEDIIKTYGNAE